VVHIRSISSFLVTPQQVIFSYKALFINRYNNKIPSLLWYFFLISNKPLYVENEITRLQYYSKYVQLCHFSEASILTFIDYKLRDCSVGIVTGYGLDYRGSGVRFPAKGRNFFFSTASIPALDLTHPPIQWVQGALSPGVKRPGRESDPSPPSSA
jgi:hypothetical protein